jgi:hypothetical protein
MARRRHQLQRAFDLLTVIADGLEEKPKGMAFTAIPLLDYLSLV